jgi:hypothetical protein
MPRVVSFLAKATIPVLSKTLMSARCTAMYRPPEKHNSVRVARFKGKKKEQRAEN